MKKRIPFFIKIDFLMQVFMILFFVAYSHLLAQDSPNNCSSTLNALPQESAAGENFIFFTDAQLTDLGHRLWETYNSEKKIILWDERGFACVGIAQFLWEPAGVNTIFGDDWRSCALALKSQGVALEDWMLGPSPWSSEEEFNRAVEQHDPRLEQLRVSLSTPLVIREQARVIVERFQKALFLNSENSILNNLPPGEAELLLANAKAVANVCDENQRPLGLFALIDYTHFKGEGLDGGYNTQSWGLQRVLWNMQNIDPAFVRTHSALEIFVASAEEILEERILNYRIERDRNNTPVPNDKPDAHFDESVYRDFWYNHLNNYFSWPEAFTQQLN